MVELTQIIDVLFSSGVFIPAIWLSLGFLIAGLVLSAKLSVPMNHKEIDMLWNFHKQKTKCKSKSCKEIIQKNRIVGFECECGFNHIQKKPLINFRES